MHQQVVHPPAAPAAVTRPGPAQARLAGIARQLGGAPPVQRLQRTAGIVQRAIDHADPVITENRNVAVAWKGGGDYAVTPSIFNGHEIPPKSNKNGMIRSPGYDLEGDHNPFQVRMTVPTQVVGYRLELPTDGPWDLGRNVSVANISAFLADAGVKVPNWSDEEEKLPATLRVVSDGDLKGQIRAHEMHHVAEQDTAVNEILVPWDQELDLLKVKADGLTVDGPLDFVDVQPTIEPKKDAQQIADALFNRLESLGKEYHATDEGKPPVVTSAKFAKGDPWLFTIALKLAKV